VGEKTAIAWTESTHNFWVGCRKVSQGCKHCYAERQMTRYGRDFRTVTRAKGFDAPLRWDPRMVFVNSWSDFFIEEADPWRADAWEVIRRTSQHTYQILTKRPERIAACLPRDWGEGWAHVWLGTSVESQECVGRLDDLAHMPAVVRFVSAEPLLGPLDLRFWLRRGAVDWLIVGGESGPKARPMDMAWARSLRDQAVEHGVPFFFKQQSGPYAGIRPYIVETDGSETAWQQMPERVQPSIQAAASNQLALWEER